MKRVLLAVVLLIIGMSMVAVGQVPGPTLMIGANGTPIQNGTSGDCLKVGSTNRLSSGSCASAAVSSFSGGTTGFTPSSPTTGAVVLAGTLAKANGGTGSATGLAAAAALSLPYVLCHTSTSASITGTVSETILGWCNIPAAIMGTQGCVLTDLMWQYTAGGAAANWVQSIRVITGTSNGTTAGTQMYAITGVQPAAGRYAQKICSANSTTAQFGSVGNVPYGGTSGGYVSAALNTANAWTVSYNATLGNTGDTIALRGATTTVIQSAGN